MTTPVPQQQQPSWRFEQHVGTVLQIMVVGLLGWSLKTSVDMKSEIAVLNAKLESLQVLVNQSTSDIYTQTRAAQDLSAVWAAITRLDNRCNRIEDEKHRH